MNGQTYYGYISVVPTPIEARSIFFSALHFLEICELLALLQLLEVEISANSYYIRRLVFEKQLVNRRASLAIQASSNARNDDKKQYLLAEVERNGM